MGKTKGAYRVLVVEYEGRRPLRRPGRKWEDNIKVYLEEIGSGGVDGLIWLGTGTGGGLL
jgi:hypothetical protein